jgi:hypothetical protein
MGQGSMSAARPRTSNAARQRELAKVRQRKHRALQKAGLEEFTLALPWAETHNELIERGMSEADALRRDLVEQRLAEIVCCELFEKRTQK